MSTWNAVAAGSALTVQVGDGGAIATNPNPTAYNNVWTARTSGTTANLYGIAWNTAYFVAVGANGAGVRSADGITWELVYPGVSTDLNDIASGGNVFIAVGNAGVILNSQDGAGWSVIPSGVSVNLWGVSIGAAEWIAVGDNSTILTGQVTSTDLNVLLGETVACSSVDGVNAYTHHTLAESIKTAGQFNRFIYGPAFKDTYAGERAGVGDAVDSGDGSGSINSIAGTSSPVVVEAVVLPNDNGDELGGPGSGLPSFISLLEKAVFFRLGDFSSWHTLTLNQDSPGIHDRLFDSFEKVLQVLALSDSLVGARGYFRALLNTLTLHAVNSAAAAYADALLSTARATDSISTVGAFVLVVPETATLNSLPVSGARLNLMIAESIFSVSELTLNGETYTGWVLDSAALAPTEYRGFDFNSMTTFNGVNYAAKEDGIYKLEGETDNGAAIAAAITLGQDDFGTSYQKKVERAYLGLRNDGSMVLKAILLDAATQLKTEYWYELTSISATIRKERIKLPRGLKAHYWQFELINANGADFELDTLEVYPLILTRRV